MRIEIPELCLVALVGVSGSGKSTFAKAHFKPTEVLSSDYFRALVSDDENNQAVSAQAFDALYYVARKRLELGLLTVIDATNVQSDARREIIRLAKEQNIHAAAIVLDLPEQVCRERNEKRADRDFGASVIAKQSAQLKRSLKYLKKDGFRFVYTLKSEADIAECEIVRTPLWSDKKSERGPFDIIGDVHGCFDELAEMLQKLGYAVDAENFAAAPPEGRRAVFLGDLCDRGPGNVEVLRLVMNMCASGAAYCVPGNHDAKLLKHLRGKDVQRTHGLDATIEQLDGQNEDFRREVAVFLDGLVSHYVFDGGRLVVAHAGLPEKLQGRASSRVRSFCLYGDTDGETDEFGLPVRLPWAEEYRGRALIVYGHTPVPEVRNVNGAVCIDTGCVFGGKLTALRYPERES
ncbi:MAG: AAA family ATPase, partial [Oscillospiraceae bacterium]|nr:AAA family ATPase [Oscillospiraceae bacterium]